MLFLLFDLNADRYALECSHIVEILPVVRIKHVPMAPRGIAGVINYRGVVVPVVDLTALVLERPSRSSLSTRLVVADCGDEGGPTRLLGLMIEHATATVRRPRTDFVGPAIRIDGAPFLGPVATDDNGIVQLIDVSKLLTPSLRDALRTDPAEH